MALSGVRISPRSNTPPEERLPIVTHVGPYYPPRPGQGRRCCARWSAAGRFSSSTTGTDDRRYVGSFETARARGAPSPLPTGRCPKPSWPSGWRQFTQGEVDVLLSTLDHRIWPGHPQRQHADRRPGGHLRPGAALTSCRAAGGARGAARAYAYFFRHKRKATSLRDRQRLETIAENTPSWELGFSNCHAATWEIRGQANVLGTRQHGHIAAVGFYLYTNLLAEAVRRLRMETGLPAAPLAQAISPQNLQLSTIKRRAALAVQHSGQTTCRIIKAPAWGCVPAHGRHALASRAGRFDRGVQRSLRPASWRRCSTCFCSSR